MLDALVERYGEDFFDKNKLALWAKRVFWATNIVMVLIVMFRPANYRVNRHQAFYNAIHGPSVVYFDDSGWPFGEALTTRYYMRPDIEMVPMDIVDTILPEANRQVFIGTSDRELVKKYEPVSKVVFQSHPDWIKRFDFNGWVGRTSFYYILEVKKPNE